jgi:hypothetical protein
MSYLFLFPPWEQLCATNITFGSQTMNSTTNDIGIVFQMPEAATITAVAFRQSSITGTPGTLRVGLQGVSATTGLNDGTYLGGATNYVDYTGWASGNNNTFIVNTLPSGVTVTRGQLVCLYLKPQAVGTWNASNLAAISTSIQDWRRGFVRPYKFINANKSTAFEQIPFFVRSSTKTYGNPYQTFSAPALTNTSNPDEIGLAFTINSSSFSTYQVAGVRLTNNIASASGTFNVVLYNNTTALQTVAVDTDQISRFATNGVEILFEDSTLATLNTGTEYILGQKATSSAANACQPSYATLPTNGDLSAISTETIRYAERQTTGAWSFTNNTRLPMVSLLIKTTAFTGGGGGLLVHPGTAGGMRG